MSHRERRIASIIVSALAAAKIPTAATTSIHYCITPVNQWRAAHFWTDLRVNEYTAALVKSVLTVEGQHACKLIGDR